MAETEVPYVATMRLVYKAASEPQARVIAEVARNNVMNDLEPDDGDECEITEVSNFNSAATDHELIDQMIALRNKFIRLKINRFFDMAKELDFLAWHLRQRLDATHAEYDHTAFLETAQKVWNGEFPTD